MPVTAVGAAGTGLPPPVTWNVRATCELNGPAQPAGAVVRVEDPFRVDGVVGRSRAHRCRGDAGHRSDEDPVLPQRRRGEMRQCTHAERPGVAPVPGSRATRVTVEKFRLQTTPPPITGGPPAALVCQPGVSDPSVPT